MSIEWKDVSQWNRNEDRSKGPKTVEAQVAWARIVVTRHIHYPGWLLTCPDFGINEHIQLTNVSLEDAKTEALNIIEMKIELVRKVLWD